jgi:predicted DNA-binding transcriptional regulator AlpA
MSRETLMNTGISDPFESVRVLDEVTAAELVGVSRPTWTRMRERGETPPCVQLSKRRIGYRVSDLKAWLEARSRSSAYPTPGAARAAG